MKKELGFPLTATIIAIITGIAPLYISWAKDRDLRVLCTRSPAPATKHMRGAIANATEVRAYTSVQDSYLPYPPIVNDIKRRQPSTTFRGKELRELVKVLQAERYGYSEWKPFFAVSVPGSIEFCTVLEFFENKRSLTVITLSSGYGFRWYHRSNYKADAPMLPETWLYHRRTEILSP